MTKIPRVNRKGSDEAENVSRLRVEVRDETVQDERVIDGLEMDIVSHDVKKFFGLLL